MTGPEIEIHWTTVCVRVPTAVLGEARKLAEHYGVPLDRVASLALAIVADYAADARSEGRDPFPTLRSP